MNRTINRGSFFETITNILVSDMMKDILLVPKENFVLHKVYEGHFAGSEKEFCPT
jgi:hypothetical protein